MAIQDLKIWAEELTVDGVTGIKQRRKLNGEEFRDGILRQVTFSSQQYNSLQFLLTLYSNPFHLCPVLVPTSISIPNEALEMDGQTITALDFPNAFAVYGATLPDLRPDAPSGFTYVIRKS